MVTLPVSVYWPDQVISVEIVLSVAFVFKGVIKETSNKITRRTADEFFRMLCASYNQHIKPKVSGHKYGGPARI